MAGEVQRCGDTEQREHTNWEVTAVPSFLWKNSSTRIDPTGHWTNAQGQRWILTLLEFAGQGHFWVPMVILLPSVWAHVDTWLPPIFIPEATKVQTHMMQLADFIPRDHSTNRLSDLPKGMHWVKRRTGNKTQSPDARASFLSLDTSPNRENNLLKYQIALVFWWVSKQWEKWVLNFLWHNPFGKGSNGCEKSVTYTPKQKYFKIAPDGWLTVTRTSCECQCKEEWRGRTKHVRHWSSHAGKRTARELQCLLRDWGSLSHLLSKRGDTDHLR